MRTRKLLLALLFAPPLLLLSQTPANNSPRAEPPLPVIDTNACPFEGCTFRKWPAIKDAAIFSSWKKDRKQIAIVRKGQIVTGLTGVHITLEPDRAKVLKPIPDLGVKPGDIILRYMYEGEGYANIWTNGKWHKDYDCSFLKEKDGSGCTRDCSAVVVSDGRKEWWVQVKTQQEATGWTKVEDQFECMDSVGGDEKCDKL